MGRLGVGMGRGKVPTGGVIGFFCGHAHDAVDIENPQTPSAIPTKLSPVCDIQNVPSEGYLAKQAHHSPQPQFPEMHSCGLHTARAVGASVGASVGVPVGGTVGVPVGGTGAQHFLSHGCRVN